MPEKPIQLKARAKLIAEELTSEQLAQLTFDKEIFCAHCFSEGSQEFLMPTLLAIMRFFDPTKMNLWICPRCKRVYVYTIKQEEIIVPS